MRKHVYEEGAMSAGISISDYFDKDLVTEDIYGISRWGDALYHSAGKWSYHLPTRNA